MSEGHRLRLSVDLRSLKDHQFTAQLYFKYGAYTPMNIAAFRSAPSIPISNPKVQTALTNCFAFSHFRCEGSELEGRLRHVLRVQLWHNDRLHADVQLGVVCIEMQKLLECPLRKFEESYARVFDAYLPVDEVDGEGHPTRTVGALRVLLYLEDQGALPDAPPANRVQLVQDVEGGMGEGAMGEGAAVRGELANLEYKVVWELETWKKAEEAKTRLLLQQREGQFWGALAEQQKKQDLEKEKQFKKMEGALLILDGKLRAKMGELMKREQKIVVLEQELQSKMGQVSKECLAKDEELDRLRLRNKEEKATLVREKAAAEVQASKLRAQLSKLKGEVEESRKQEDKSVVSLLRGEVATKQLECKELAMELSKCNEIKEQYKVYYNKMKEELISVRRLLAQKEEACRQTKYQRDLAQNNLRNAEQQLHYERSAKQPSYEHEEPPSERDRLIRARQDLLNQGMYSPHDDLIQQYDRSIAQLR